MILRINWNNRYLTISVYVLLSITAGILIFKFLNGISGYTAFAHAVLNIVRPILYGVIIAYFLSPVEKLFEYRLFPRVSKNRFSDKTYRYLGITFSYLTLVGLLFFILYAAIPELTESFNKILKSIPAYYSYIESLLSEMSEKSIDISGFFIRIEDMLKSYAGRLTGTLSASLEIVVNLALGIVISIYLLSDRERYFGQIKKTMYAFFDAGKVDSFCETCTDAKDIFNKFMYSKIMGCVIVGIICYIGTLIMGVGNALLISVIIGVTNFIPYFGPFLGTVPCVLLIFFEGDGVNVNPIMAVIFIIFIIILQQLDGCLIGPKLQGRSVGISPFWVLISVIVFGEFFGIMGMLISVPLFAVLMSVFRNIINKRIQNKE